MPPSEDRLELGLAADGRLCSICLPGDDGLQHFGVAVAEAVKVDRVERFHGDDSPAIRANLQWLSSAAPAELTLHVQLWRHQRWTPASLRLSSRLGAGNQPAIHVDISEMVSERQLRDVLDRALQAVLVHRNGQPLYVNPSYARLLGTNSVAEAMAKTDVIESVHIDDRDMVYERASKRISGAQTPDHYEFRLCRQDGTVIWVDCLATRIDWAGEPAVQAALYDITSRKQVEAALEQSRQLFVSVFQASPDILILVNFEDMRIVDVNRSFNERFGVSRDQAIGCRLRELGIGTDHAFREQLREGLASRRAIRDLTTAIRAPSGEIRDYNISAEIIDLENRELLLVVARDITERRRHEGELRRSRDAAERANRAKSAFLANMSHELRTPLNAIIGFSEVITNQMLGPISQNKYVEYAGDIHSSGQHLLEIINDMLDLSKLEAGRLELHEEVISLADLVHASLALVRGRASEAGIALSNRFPEDFPAIYADARAIKQVLINLLSNAVKFTPRDGRVEIGAATLSDGIAFHVHDTGIGMTPADIELAFKPFGQVDSIFTREHQGTGLGLPLARSLIRLHGGEITVDSVPGAGTKVTVLLPRERVRLHVS